MQTPSGGGGYSSRRVTLIGKYSRSSRKPLTVYSSPSRYCSSTIAPAREAASARSTASASSLSARTSVTPRCAEPSTGLTTTGAPSWWNACSASSKLAASRPFGQRTLRFSKAARMRRLSATVRAVSTGRPGSPSRSASCAVGRTAWSEPIVATATGSIPCASRSPSTPPTSVKLLHDPVLGLGQQRRIGRAVHDADLVSERARLLEQPELRA